MLSFFFNSIGIKAEFGISPVKDCSPPSPLFRTFISRKQADYYNGRCTPYRRLPAASKLFPKQTIFFSSFSSARSFTSREFSEYLLEHLDMVIVLKNLLFLTDSLKIILYIIFFAAFPTKFPIFENTFIF